jgi:hypothetical protein
MNPGLPSDATSSKQDAGAQGGAAWKGRLACRIRMQGSLENVLGSQHASQGRGYFRTPALDPAPAQAVHPHQVRLP